MRANRARVEFPGAAKPSPLLFAAIQPATVRSRIKFALLGEASIPYADLVRELEPTKPPQAT